MERAVAELNKQDAAEAKKESDLSSKYSKYLEEANRTSSNSVRLSKQREADKALQDLSSIRQKRAELSSRLAAKNKDLRSYQERQAKEDQNAFKKAAEAQKKMADEQKRMIREREDHERRIRQDLTRRSNVLSTFAQPHRVALDDERFDFFISHASEDKDSFVRALAQELVELGAKIFYDEATLKIGDSLRRKIDSGPARSRFGVVVLSENFFRKEWPQRELDGLVVMEAEGSARILPIWHKISKDEVTSFSPTLADKIALNSSMKSVSEIAKELYSSLE